jgi:hypothetical protein
LIAGNDLRISFQEYAWAHYIYQTRSWNLTGIPSGADMTDSFFPIGDLLDHSDKRNVKAVHYRVNRTTVLKTTRSIAKGEVLTDSYGGGLASSSDLLIKWGILPNGGINHVFDEATVLIPFGAQAECNRTVRFRLGVLMNPNTMENLMSLLRKVAKEAQQRRGVDCAAWYSKYIGPAPQPPVSRKNEKAALLILQRACEVGISRFKTSLAADLRLLRQIPDTDVTRTLLLLRAKEKRTLQACIETTNKRLDALERY